MKILQGYFFPPWEELTVKALSTHSSRITWATSDSSFRAPRTLLALILSAFCYPSCVLYTKRYNERSLWAARKILPSQANKSGNLLTYFTEILLAGYKSIYFREREFCKIMRENPAESKHVYNEYKDINRTQINYWNEIHTDIAGKTVYSLRIFIYRLITITSTVMENMKHVSSSRMKTNNREIRVVNENKRK